jgi:hypothetical protein
MENQGFSKTYKNQNQPTLRKLSFFSHIEPPLS